MTCDKDDGATSVPLPTGRAFAFSVSPSPVCIRVKLPSALQPLQKLLPAGGAGCGLAFGGPTTPENALRRRARKRARSPPPGPMSATKPQLEPYGQAAPLALRISARSRLPDGSKWASPSSASIWGHLNRRRRPQARSHVKRHEILTASMMLRRCVKVTVGSCLGVKVPAAECPTQTTASELQVETGRQITRGVAD